MRRFLLDTNIVSALISDRSRHKIRERIDEVGADRVCTSVIVSAEIRFGIVKKGSKRLAKAARELFEAIEILPFDHPADDVYARVRADLERRGLPISANDLLIAAHCLALDATLVTNNTREFQRVGGLRTEDWLAE